MGLLDVHSLITLSRVSRRFHHLHGDESIWSDVDLTLRSLGRRLDTRKLKKIIHTYLPSSLWRINLSSNSQSISSKNAIVTEALLNDLFTRCPTIETLTLQRCDLTNVSPTLTTPSRNQLLLLYVYGCTVLLKTYVHVPH